MESIPTHGVAPFASAGSSYTVFRNVKDYGAKGDGVTDDTVAINNALSAQGRCGPSDCSSSTTTPAIVYFPSGTYIVSAPLIDYYYTQIIGNPNCMPVIKATSNFPDQKFVIDGDQYQSTGNQGWASTNVFWRQIRNIVVDTTDIVASTTVSAIHWPVGQATSLQNIIFKLSTASGNQQTGLFIENGSGGFLTDLTFYGGMIAMNVGNQQFTTRNLTFNNAVTAINQNWDWSWTYSGVTINNCGTGLSMTGSVMGSVSFIDSYISNTPVGFLMNYPGDASHDLILENVVVTNVGIIVQESSTGNTKLAGGSGTQTVAGWAQTKGYNPALKGTIQGPIVPNSRPAGLTSDGTHYYARSKPQYEGLIASRDFLSVRELGATGDGSTDDTAALQAAIFQAVATGKILYINAGDYVVTDTIVIPGGSKIVGEAYPVILASSKASGISNFADMNNPKAVVQIGRLGDTAPVEWSDAIVSTRGAQAGAILIQYTMTTTGVPTALWDVHTRIGGFVGSNLQKAQCVNTPGSNVVVPECIAAFASFESTASSRGLYLENTWFWVADHDADDQALTQLTIYAGRGMLIRGSNHWLYGTASEHHQLYQYNFNGASNIFVSLMQTETAYYQPTPGANVPFPAISALNDPVYSGGSAYGTIISSSTAINIYGAGFYSFFSNFDVSCSTDNTKDQNRGPETCQTDIFKIDTSATKIAIYGLNTVGVPNMATIWGTTISGSDNANGFVDTIGLVRTSDLPLTPP